MDATLKRLKDAFNAYVGQSIGMQKIESKAKRVVDGQIKEMTRSYLIPDEKDPVIKEMQNVADQFNTQVFFKGVISAGWGGTCVDVDTEETAPGRFTITEITPRYC